jgi:membrane-bound lytic murein transglycosylase F
MGLVAMVIVPLPATARADRIGIMSRPVVILLLLCCALAGCTRRDALDDILERGELTVVTRNSPTTYYQDRDGANGFEYALATRLAAELGVNLQVQTAFSLSDVFRLLERGEADVAAAGLTLTGDRGGRFPYSTPYSTLRPQVV